MLKELVKNRLFFIPYKHRHIQPRAVYVACSGRCPETPVGQAQTLFAGGKKCIAILLSKSDSILFIQDIFYTKVRDRHMEKMTERERKKLRELQAKDRRINRERQKFFERADSMKSELLERWGIRIPEPNPCEYVINGPAND